MIVKSHHYTYLASAEVMDQSIKAKESAQNSEACECEKHLVILLVLSNMTHTSYKTMCTADVCYCLPHSYLSKVV